jgi:hypothetical protein
MDNILKKFYSGGRDDDINPGSEKRIYENFFSTNPETINNRKSYNKSMDYREKPFIQYDENIFNKIPIVDNQFNSELDQSTRNYPSYDKLMYTQPRHDRERNFNNKEKADNIKLQMLEEKIRQLEKMKREEQEQNIYRSPKRESSKKINNLKKNLANSQHSGGNEDDIDPDSKAAEMNKLLLNFKDDLIKKLHDEGVRNRDVILNLNREFNNFKTEVKNVINTMTNKQKIQMESIKWILEHAGSKRLKGLSQRILLEDVTDMNKYKQAMLDLNLGNLNQAGSANDLEDDDDM